MWYSKFVTDYNIYMYSNKVGNTEVISFPTPATRQPAETASIKEEVTKTMHSSSAKLLFID